MIESILQNEIQRLDLSSKIEGYFVEENPKSLLIRVSSGTFFWVPKRFIDSKFSNNINLKQLKNAMSWEDLQTFIMGIISNKSIEIIEITKMMYINAINKIIEYNMDSNDISAYLLMKERKIKKIYTFDRQFEKLPEIICLPQIPKELV